MKVYIRKNPSTPTGYELVSIDELGNENVQSIDSHYKNEPHTLVLPENPSNRKYFNDLKVEKNGGQIELTYKESKTFGPRTESSPRKKLEDYLTEDEKATIQQILANAKARKEADKPKPMTEREKLEARIRKYQEQLASLGDE